MYKIVGVLFPQTMEGKRLSVQSSELGPLTPSPARECCPPFGPKGEKLACGGLPSSDEGTDTMNTIIPLRLFLFNLLREVVNFLNLFLNDVNRDDSNF